MRTLIINADDLGLSAGTNQAILSLLQTGGITSTTLMVNGPAVEDAVSGIDDAHARASIGLHVNLTQFDPVGSGDGLSSILGEDGHFAGRRALFRAGLSGLLNAEDVSREIDAQWKKCTEHGVLPSHLDTHQHAHLVPVVFRALQEFAREKGMPVRRLGTGVSGSGLKRKLTDAAAAGLAHFNEWRMPRNMSVDAKLITIFSTGEQPSIAAYRALLENCRATQVELMVHPAIVDEIHREATRISAVSQRDYEVLSSAEWREYLANCGYRLASFRDLARQ